MTNGNSILDSGETPLPISEMAKKNGVSKSTIYKYITYGLIGLCGQRIRLESCKTEKGLCTSEDALRRWRKKMSDPEFSVGSQPRERT